MAVDRSLSTVKIFVASVVIIPEVNVNVPSISFGLESNNPDELFIMTLLKALEAVKLPEPDITCWSVPPKVTVEGSTPESNLP